MNVTAILNNLKTKLVCLDVGKLKTVLVDLKKLNDAVDNRVVKNKKVNALKIQRTQNESK